MNKPKWSVPELEYIEVGRRPHPYSGHYLTPIVPCPECGERFVWDPNRDGQGYPWPRNPLDPLDDDRTPPLCDVCLDKDWAEAFEADTLATIEKRLGLSEKDRDALKSFIETVFTDPKKILKVQELENRVSGLETQKNALWVAWAVTTALLAVVVTVAVAGL